MRWLPLRIHGETFPHEPEVKIQELAVELVEAGTFVVYEYEGRLYGHVTGFTKWQNPHRNESPSKIPAPPGETDFAACFSALGQPKDNQGTTKGQPMESPILVTSCQLPVASSEILVASSTSPDGEVSPARSRTDSGAVPTPEFTDPVLAYLVQQWGPLLGKSESLPKWIQTARDAYPGIDLLSEAKRAAAWEMANPANKKKQVRAFLTRWWGRAQDRGGPGQRPGGSSKTEDAIALALKLGATQ